MASSAARTDIRRTARRRCMSAEKETAPAGAAVFILLEAGREGRIIPVCDDDSQEPAIAPLLERARRMVEADAEELARC